MLALAHCQSIRQSRSFPVWTVQLHVLVSSDAELTFGPKNVACFSRLCHPDSLGPEILVTVLLFGPFTRLGMGVLVLHLYACPSPLPEHPTE